MPPRVQSTRHPAISRAAVKSRNPGQEFLNCCLWRGSMSFGCGKLPKIKSRCCDHLFGLWRWVISHQGPGQDGREDSMKLNLINHPDRKTRTKPSVPRIMVGNLGNGKKKKTTSSLTQLYLNLWKLKIPHGDFPGDPVVKTPCFQCKGLGFYSWLGN